VSRTERASARSSSLNRSGLTGLTTLQCCPSGQRCIRHGPSRNAFTDTPGIQVVVNRCPRWQRTIVRSPRSLPLRRLSSSASISVAPPAITNPR
jgi:hypothetical protein